MSDYDQEDFNNEDEGSENASGGGSSSGDFRGEFGNNNKLSQTLKNKATQKAKEAGKKALKEVGKKAVKVAGKVAVKAIAVVLKFLIVTVGPYLLIAIGVVILLYCAWDVIFNSRGKTQDYQTEDVNEFNDVEFNQSTGEINAVDLSTGNKLTKAFYTYFAEKSLYVTVSDKNGNVVEKNPLQYNSPEFIKKYGEGSSRTLKDKYDREKMFYLNPNALWSLDEFLNQNRFRYPEQFIKPVYHDPDTFALKDLVDKDGKLVAESKKYTEQTTDKKIFRKDKNGKLRQVYIDAVTHKLTFESSTNNGMTQNKEATEKVTAQMIDPSGAKEKGVWDYGFGSIVNYKEFEEEREGQGEFQTTTVWDVQDEKMLHGIDLNEAEKMCRENPERYQGYDSNYPKGKEFVDPLPSGKSYMIDRVTSPAGFVTNSIKCEWEDTGKSYTKTVEVEKEVSIWREHERQVMRIDPSDPYKGDKPVYLDPDGNDTFEPYHKVIITPGSPAVPEVPPSASHPGSPAIPEVEEVSERVPNKPKMEKYMKEEKIKQTFQIIGNGTEHEKVPRYEGDPDLGAVTGSKYFIDYMTNYESYVPHNVMANLGISDFTNRTGAEHEQLLKLLERESFTGNKVGTVDLGSFDFGSGAESQPVQKAMEHYDAFVEWGETYGVDPLLLVAIASQESGGNHEAQLNSSHGYGLMQIEQPGTVIKSATAYNFKTRSMETMNIPNRESVKDVSMNIKAGAMLQANRMKNAEYNMLFGLQSYNFGSGAFDLAVKKYASDNNKSYEEILNDPNDIGWTAYVLDFHKNPNNYLSTPWYENAGYPCKNPRCDEQGQDNHYGDPGYLQNVLRYYVSVDGEFPWVLKEDGTKVSMNGAEFQMGSGTPGGSNDSWVKKVWESIVGKKSDIFPMMTPENQPETTQYSHKLPRNQAEITHKMMFVMEEKKLLSEYEDFTDDDWKAKFNLWFSNPIGSKWKGKGGQVDSKGIFPDGFGKPLKFSPLVVDTAFELPKHSGIDIVAPVGSDVLSISKGEVVDINEKGGNGKGKYITIKHSSGSQTIYGGLSEISVKKGDKVNGAVVIGKTGNTHDKKNVLYLELISQGKTVDPTWIVNGNFNASDYNMSAEDAEIIQDIISMAQSKIGCRYTQEQGLRSGPNSFDCSGLTWWLYKTRTGENIGTWTNQQDDFLNNYRVPVSDIQPGDILMKSDLSHVVLYIGKENGKDTIIHAANKNLGVIKSQYTSMSSTEYVKAYRPIAYIRAKQSSNGQTLPN